MYDNIDDMEKSIAVCRDRKKAIEELSALIDEIQVYEEEQVNGQWLKSIGFNLPIIDSEMDLSLDNDGHEKNGVIRYRNNNKERKQERLFAKIMRRLKNNSNRK